MRKCAVPGCTETNATQTWAQLPICNEHYNEVRDETDRYYSKKINASERVLHNQLAQKIPWARKGGE